MRRSDSLPPVPGNSFPRLPVPARTLFFRSPQWRVLPLKGLGFGLPVPFTGVFWSETVGSPRFLANPQSHAPLFLHSDGPAMPGLYGIDGVAFPLHVQGRRPQIVISELSTQPTTSLSTLHRFGYPHGARLASGWRPTLARRDSHPQGSTGKFLRLRCHLLTHVILSPFPRLRLAHTWHRSYSRHF